MNSAIPKPDHLLNDLTSYCWQLNYSTRGQPGKIGALLTTPTTHWLRAIDLNPLVCAHPDALPQRVKKAWDDFYSAFLEQNEKSIHCGFIALRKVLKVSTSPSFLNNVDLRCFDATDLYTVPDETPDPLPLNAIRGKEKADAISLYDRFVSRLHFSPKNQNTLGSFTRNVKWALQVIMSRPVGRRLIQEIDDLMSPLETISMIESNGGFEFKKNKIRWSNNKTIRYITASNGYTYSLESDAYRSFAHELIHLKHFLKREQDHFDDPTLDPRFANPEEKRTIDGSCKCHPYDPINEITLSREHQPQCDRHTHRRGAAPTLSPEELLESGLADRADGDVLVAFHRGISPEALHRIIESAKSQSPLRFLQNIKNTGQLPDVLGTSTNSYQKEKPPHHPRLTPYLKGKKPTLALSLSSPSQSPPPTSSN